MAGALKAMGAGIVLTILGSLIAGVGSTFQPANFIWLLLLITATSFAFISMMFVMMVRVNDPLIPRAVFGILNTLLVFSQRRYLSGAGFSQVAAMDRLD